MLSIFYDLETTSQDPVGQILNYSFIAVDERFELVDECSGLIRISPLELPRAGAILANRVNVIEHQREAKLSEVAAMKLIAKFIAKCARKSSAKVPFIGYNSARFDLPFLRTSLVRSGISPYFRGAIISRDLLFVVRNLSTTRSDFPRPEKEHEGEKRLSLSLESMCHEFGLLTGEQQHESRADVLLTIELAKLLLERFELDVRTYEPYGALKFHRRKYKQEPCIVEQLRPNYDLEIPSISSATPYTLLDTNQRGDSLWLSLDEESESEFGPMVRWFSPGSRQFIVGRDLSEESTLVKKRADLLAELGEISLDRFFSTSTCDIEQDIYRIHSESFDTLDLLIKAIETGDKSLLDGINNKDAKVLFTRFFLRNERWSERDEKKAREMLASYARYRYGGKLQLSKQTSEDDDRFSERYHIELSEMVAEIRTLAEAGSAEDRSLLRALLTYYRTCEISDTLKELDPSLLSETGDPQESSQLGLAGNGH